MTNPSITVAVGRDGKQTVIHDGKVSLKDQKHYCRSAKISPLPKGAVRVERWERVFQTTGLDVEAQKQRLGEETKEEKAPEKPAS